MKKKKVTFEEFQNEVEDILFKYIMTIARHNRHYAEEIYQSVMTNAWQNIRKLKALDQSKAWAFAIARSEARRYFANSKNGFKNEVLASHIDLDNIDKAERSLDFTDEVISLDTINTLLSKVDMRTRQVFEFRYVYDNSLEEIANILNLNYSSVRSIHVRGLLKLQQIIDEEGNDE